MCESELRFGFESRFNAFRAGFGFGFRPKKLNISDSHITGGNQTKFCVHMSYGSVVRGEQTHGDRQTGPFLLPQLLTLDVNIILLKYDSQYTNASKIFTTKYLFKAP